MDPAAVIRNRLLAAEPDLAASAVTPDARMSDLIPDSMTRLDMLTEVLEELGITASLRDFAGAGTVGELTDLVATRVAG